MAGTPTPNYQFPTYAETDTPNLAGAYNQAVNAIDAKIKEVADSVSSGGDVPDATSTTKGIAKLYDSTTIGDSTQDDGGVTPAAMKNYVHEKVSEEPQEYTAGAGILIEGTKISARGAYTISSDTIDTVESTGLPTESPGTVVAACSESSLVDRIVAVNNAEHGWPGGAVPTVQVLKDYVESKMVAAGAAYTGTFPVVVDNEAKTISVQQCGTTTYDAEDGFAVGTVGCVPYGRMVNIDAYNAMLTDTGASNRAEAVGSVPSVALMSQAIAQATPDASTSVKGLVQLDDTLNTNKADKALTGKAFRFADGIYNSSSRALTVADLSRLMVNEATGLVYLCNSNSE